MNKTFLSLVVAALLFAGCDWRGVKGNGNVITENREAAPFTTIAASGAYRIEWAVGAPAVSIKTDQNLMGFIRTRIEDGRLTIKTRERINPTDNVEVVLTGPALAEIELTGAARFTGKGVTGDKLLVTTTGASRVTLDGSVNSLTATHTGASKLRAADLQTQKAVLELTGASDAEINVQQTLEVEISGAGKVTYSGNPQILKQDIAGAGKIRRRD